MTKNSEMTAAMFEEIREKLVKMNEKLDDVNYNHELTKSEILSNIEKQNDRSINIDSVVNYLLKSISGIINASACNLSNQIDKIFPVLDNQTSVSQSFHAEVLQGLKKRKQLMVKVIGFQILAIVSILFNVYFMNENQRLKDIELQLNYLKATNNINEEVASRLDTIFNMYRDEEVIDFIKQSLSGN
ncbi:hypothetical protein [Carboxylicivirga marina]|uniref:Uncharacterized protein n=1 Tax=Carboxylicivirga marina TaxID=2800988 RepID=A0ABS1HF06_9BACT|nr:hypothetical protein [Carboxylicivirga marina]MBK3516221.1 hypothetical protein [Carboxylicivirga marina]